MEDFSRRALVALVVAAAGPAAAMLTLLLVAPALVASNAPATDGGIVETTGSLLVGLFVGGLLAGVVAYVVGAGATLAALVATTWTSRASWCSRASSPAPYDWVSAT
jgi:hypothetical protein